MALNLKKRWADSKALYEETVGKKKPAKDFLVFIGRSSTGVESSLAAFDSASEAAGSAPGDALLTKLAAAGETAKQAMSKYAKLLDDRTKKDKLTDPAYTKGLDLLSKELDAIAAVIDEQVKTLKRNMKTVEKAAAARSPEEFSALANKSVQKNFKLNGAAVVKELAAGVAKLRAKPDPELYRNTLPIPLRDIGNQFGSGNLKQLGLEKLTQGSSYPRKAIDELSALEHSTKHLSTEAEVKKALDLIGSRATVVAAWFVNVARVLA